jgi:predicted AlkP superfamily phosphohydrolase/phosphomutase/Flp pilus assembly protein TadD
MSDAVKPLPGSGRGRVSPGLLAAAIALLAVLLASAAASGGSDARTASAPVPVVVLGIDGLDPDVIDRLVSEGKMASFARLRREGAYGRLLSSKPILSPIIWTTIATGKNPTEHGIGHFTAVNEKTGEHLPVTSQMRRVKALWNLLGDAGRKVAVVGWWATWPAESVNGIMVSDHTCYHFLFDAGFTGGKDSLGVVHPPERLSEVKELVTRPDDVAMSDLERFVRVTPEEFARPFDFDDDLSHFKWAWATAESYRRIGLELWKNERPDLLMVYVEGVDSSSHLFGHLYRAQGLSGDLAAQQRRFGDTVEQMYLYADRMVGEYMAAIGPSATLVVLSDHGFELGALPEDPSKTRDMRRVSAKNHRIEGVLYLWGSRVRPGARLEQPTLLDVAPTVLSLSGVPPAQDMPGRVLQEGIDLAVGPRLVRTYEPQVDAAGVAAATAPPERAAAGARDGSVEPAILERLRALGYLEAESPAGDRTMAGLAFEQGNYEEALASYRKQLEASPNDASLHASLAAALGALGRYGEARSELERSLELEPLNPGAHHNLGVIHERENRRDEAIQSYRTALRYDPSYEASRRALERLGVSPVVRIPSSAAETRARELLDEASMAARKTDYPRAVALLDEAAKLAPSYVLVHQYRANVAFLMGDREAAKRALRAALEIEPDNALFRRNLQALESESNGNAKVEGKSVAAQPAPSPTAIP